MREQTIDIDSFARRHIGPNDEEVGAMLREIGFDSLDALIDATVPKDIRLNRQLNLPEAKSEREALAELRTIAQKNEIVRSFAWQYRRTKPTVSATAACAGILSIKISWYSPMRRQASTRGAIFFRRTLENRRRYQSSSSSFCTVP